MTTRLLGFLFALCFTSHAEAQTPWSITGSGCVPDETTIKFERHKVGLVSVQHAAGNVDPIALTCPIARFDSGGTHGAIELIYQDSTGNGPAKAFVRARLYQMALGSATPSLLATASSNSSPVTTLNILTSPLFPNTFDFDQYVYWVRVEMDRSSTGQTVIFHSVALLDVTISDIRLKQNIALLGHLDNGLGFYRFSYNGSDQAYVGVMAQEVETIMPNAVLRGSDGHLRVNYSRLGFRMQTWEDWVASGEKIPATAVSAAP